MLFDQRPGSERNNSISCLDHSISCFETQFWAPWEIWRWCDKISFLIRGLEVGEIIPFPVWIIPFPDLKINFGLLDKNKKYFVNSKHIQADSVYIAYIYDPSRSNHIQLEPHRAKQIKADSLNIWSALSGHLPRQIHADPGRTRQIQAGPSRSKQIQADPSISKQNHIDPIRPN